MQEYFHLTGRTTDHRVMHCSLLINPDNISATKCEQFKHLERFIFTEAVLKITIKDCTTETITHIKTQHPFATVSAEEVKRRLFPNLSEEDALRIFKEDLYLEVTERKISRIKYHRIINKMTQQELADKLGMYQSNVARLEKTEYKPDLEILKQLGKVFKIDFKELIEE
ncbi:MAG: helix-turn-helix transcriptional regulator [Deltaproteobacteria bacterium]